MFDRVTLIGCGLIGSSLAHAIKRKSLAGHLTVVERDEVLSRVRALNLADDVTGDAAAGVQDADLVIICTPHSAYASVAETIAGHLKPGAILSDVGSVKKAAVEALDKARTNDVFFIPGHPIAGTENSGPEAGFAELFQDRWAILTPLTSDDAVYANNVAKLEAFWRACGSNVTTMPPDHHDRVLAMTSHLPHLIAYSIVDTCVKLEDTMQQEVIAFSASGFRDFTRIAASDPTMWRDIFLNNREAVLDGLQRFIEDLMELQKAIRWQDGDKLFDVFTKTRAVRRSIIDQRQHIAEENKKRS